MISYLFISEYEIFGIEFTSHPPMTVLMAFLQIPQIERIGIRLGLFSHNKKIVIYDKNAKFIKKPIVATARNGTALYGTFCICFIEDGEKEGFPNTKGMSDEAICISLNELKMVNKYTYQTLDI
jgi:hypothetical protein